MDKMETITVTGKNLYMQYIYLYLVIFIQKKKIK